MGKSVFVTVGTTDFDLLIKTVCETKNLLTLKELGFSKIILQIGRGKYEPKNSVDGITLDFFRYKDSILETILKSDFIISHAGAGTCLEVLRAQKLLLTVINEELMDNHQFELARDFHKDGYLHYCTCKDLNETLKLVNNIKLKPYPSGNADKFIGFLNKYMGYD